MTAKLVWIDAITQRPAIRYCTSPVRVRVKKASDRRWRWRKTAARRSCITRWPTWFERSVWKTPRAPVAIAIAMIPPALKESAVVSFRAIASRTRLSRNAGRTPSPADATIRTRTALSRSLYGANSRPIRRELTRRTAGSTGRSGGASAEWKNMPTRYESTQRGAPGGGHGAPGSGRSEHRPDRQVEDPDLRELVAGDRERSPDRAQRCAVAIEVPLVAADEAGGALAERLPRLRGGVVLGRHHHAVEH